MVVVPGFRFVTVIVMSVAVAAAAAFLADIAPECDVAMVVCSCFVAFVEVC